MMSTRNLILEMAVYSENDVFAMSPVVSLSSKETEALEDGDLLQYVLSHIQSVKIPSNCRIQSNDIGVVIRHHCGHRNLKKAALLAIPYIMNINLPTAPWRKKTDSNGRPINPKDKRLSGMMSAPILIDGTKYLCNLTAKKDNQGIISPYAITLKDESGDIVEKEKMDSHCQVPNSDSEPTTSGNARLNKVATSLEANPSSDTKIIKESKTRKDMKQNKKTINESDQYAYAIKRIKRAMRILKDNLKDCKISLRDGGTIDIKRPSYLDSQNFRKMVYNVVNSYNLGDEEFRLEDFGNKNTNVLCLIYNDELYSDEDIDKMDSRTTNKPNNEYKWVNKGAEEDFKSNGANSLEKYIKDLLKESKTRKDMKQNKKTINEAQLRAIVSEAVKSVLEEGKVVNNKPHFNYHGKGNEEKYPHPHQFVKPYQSIGDGFGGYDQDEIDRHNQHVENKRGRDIMPRHYDLMDAKAMNEYGIDAKEWRKIDYKVRIKLIDYLGLYN